MEVYRNVCEKLCTWKGRTWSEGKGLCAAVEAEESGEANWYLVAQKSSFHISFLYYSASACMVICMRTHDTSLRRHACVRRCSYTCTSLVSLGSFCSCRMKLKNIEATEKAKRSLLKKGEPGAL